MTDDPKRIAVGHKRLYSAPLKFNGMDVVFDPDMPVDEVRIIDRGGKVLVRAVPAATPFPGRGR